MPYLFIASTLDMDAETLKATLDERLRPITQEMASLNSRLDAVEGKTQ